MTYGQLETWASNVLAADGLAFSRRDVQLLLMGATGLQKSALIAAVNDVCPVKARTCFEAYVQRHRRHEPVHRILGHREFHGLDLALNDATLEPRDDTECLIELALAQVADRNAPVRLLDLGTGTGAVVLALLSELPNATALATDLEPKALQAAMANARANGLAQRFSALQSDWFQHVDGKFDLILSNPPYIVREVLQTLAPEVTRFDPPLALDGGEDGLNAYRTILSEGRDYLAPNGFLVLEIGHDQKELVSDLAVANAWKVKQTAKDLGGNDRAICLS